MEMILVVIYLLSMPGVWIMFYVDEMRDAVTLGTFLGWATVSLTPIFNTLVLCGMLSEHIDFSKVIYERKK
jgi:hypothetical protein